MIMKKMHKKSLLFLSTGMMLFSLVGCGKTPGGYSGPIHLLFGGYQTDSTKQTIDSISYKILNDRLTTSKESMVLVIYGDTGCGCWVNFQPLVARANYEKQLAIKKINVGDFEGAGKTSFGMDLSVVMPSVALFENGTLVKQISYGSSADIFTHQEKFNKFLDDNVVYPKLGYEISEADLDNKISQNETFNLYVGRCGCGDCASINLGGLNAYASTLSEEVNEPLYYFDMQLYRDRDTTDHLYQPTKTKYGLTVGNNPIFGYGTDEEGGVFPTLQRRTGNIVTDMIAVLNDKVNETEAPYTLNSYFTTERVNAMQFLGEDKAQYILDGKEVPEEEVGVAGTYRYVKQSYQETLHNPILKMFLETYVK